MWNRNRPIFHVCRKKRFFGIAVSFYVTYHTERTKCTKATVGSATHHSAAQSIMPAGQVYQPGNQPVNLETEQAVGLASQAINIIIQVIQRSLFVYAVS